MKVARTSDYTEKKADAICDLIADGNSLKTICEMDNMPSRTSVYRWLAEQESFRDKYARAKEEHADAIFDDIIHIADTETDSQKARVRIDARKWVAGKIKPKKYGEKNTTDLNIGAQDSLSSLLEAVDKAGKRIGDK